MCVASVFVRFGYWVFDKKINVFDEEEGMKEPALLSQKVETKPQTVRIHNMGRLGNKTKKAKRILNQLN